MFILMCYLFLVAGLCSGIPCATVDVIGEGPNTSHARKARSQSDTVVIDMHIIVHFKHIRRYYNPANPSVLEMNNVVDDLTVAMKEVERLTQKLDSRIRFNIKEVHSRQSGTLSEKAYIRPCNTPDPHADLDICIPSNNNAYCLENNNNVPDSTTIGCFSKKVVYNSGKNQFRIDFLSNTPYTQSSVVYDPDTVLPGLATEHGGDSGTKHVMLITDVNFSNILGMAFVGRACTDIPINVSWSRAIKLIADPRTIVTIAHELGHSFGLGHRDPAQNIIPHTLTHWDIMNPVIHVYDPLTWASTNVIDNLDCPPITSPDIDIKPVCGDGWIGGSERCDPLAHKESSDICSNTCGFFGSETCDPYAQLCCESIFELKPINYVCRQAQSSMCDKEETCDGISPFCPEDTTVPPTDTPESCQGICIAGMCSKHLQCPSNAERLIHAPCMITICKRSSYTRIYHSYASPCKMADGTGICLNRVCVKDAPILDGQPLPQIDWSRFDSDEKEWSHSSSKPVLSDTTIALIAASASVVVITITGVVVYKLLNRTPKYTRISKLDL